MMVRNVLVLLGVLLITGSLMGNVVYATNPFNTQNGGLNELYENDPVFVDYYIYEHLFTHNINFINVYFTKKDRNDHASYTCYVMISDSKSEDYRYKKISLPCFADSRILEVYAGSNWDRNDFRYNIGYFRD